MWNHRVHEVLPNRLAAVVKEVTLLLSDFLELLGFLLLLELALLVLLRLKCFAFDPFLLCPCVLGLLAFNDLADLIDVRVFLVSFELLPCFFLLLKQLLLHLLVGLCRGFGLGVGLL